MDAIERVMHVTLSAMAEELEKETPGILAITGEVLDRFNGRDNIEFTRGYLCALLDLTKVLRKDFDAPADVIKFVMEMTACYHHYFPKDVSFTKGLVNNGAD